MTSHDTPRPPVAKCAHKSCTQFLSFERCFDGEWVCGCDECEDGEWDTERGYHRCDPTGRGDTPEEAFAAYCERTDVLPEELLVEGEQHV